MKIKKISFLLVLVLVLSSFAACGGKSQAEKGKVRLILDWTPSTNHTGIYMAQALGYYDDVGIELEILQPPESGPMALVASGKGEFGITFQEELAPALASSAPLPVTAIATIITHNTSGIISLADKDIKTPKDLEGKRLVAWDTPLVAGIVESLVEADGGDFGKVDMVFNNVTDIVSNLQTAADAVWIYYAWDGVATEVAGLDTNFFYISDQDPVFDFYTPIIVAGDDYLKENPEQVKDFLAATTKGYQYAMENPEEAAKKFVEIVPELNYDMVLAGQKYLADKYQQDVPRWGEIDETRWTNFFDWMYENKIIDKELGNQGFTNEYLPS